MPAFYKYSQYMFKKNPLRPPVIVDLKRVPNGYKVQPSEAVSLFQIKRVTRTMYRRLICTIQPISSKLPTWAWSRRDSPSPAPSYSRPPLPLPQLLQAGSNSTQFIPSSGSSFLSSLPTRLRRTPSPLQSKTRGFTDTIATL